MIVEVFDERSFIVSCNSRDLLEDAKETLDGYKVRRKNQIVVPFRSGPKVFRFQSTGLEWGKGALEAIMGHVERIKKRKKNISIIKSQYGKDIPFDYEYKGKYDDLMDHQKVMFNMVAYSDVAALLADPGTCKTAAYLCAIDKRIKKGQVKKALVVTLSDLKKNVLAEMADQVPHMSGVILKNKAQANKVLNHGYKIAKKNRDYDIYISNYESMYTLVELFEDGYFDMVILDEAHRIGTPSSRQTKEIVKKFESVPYKYIITATLHANTLMSFFMPFRFMGPDTLPYANYYRFRREYMWAVDPDARIWKERAGSREIVKQIVGRISVMFTKEECLDLPPVIYQRYDCEMGSKQAKLYTDMKKDLISMVDDMCELCNKKNCCDGECEDEVSAKNALVLCGKLNQIACGFYRNTRYEVDDSGVERDVSNVIRLQENPKLKLLISVLNNIPANRKVIIWCTHVPAIEYIVEALTKAFGPNSVMTCYGSQDTYDQVQEFKKNKARYIVANTKKMGVGQNMQYSCYQVFFNNSYSYIMREQAEGRQLRKGQKNNVTVIDLCVLDTVDEVVIHAIEMKKDLSLTLSELARVINNPKEIKKIM